MEFCEYREVPRNIAEQIIEKGQGKAAVAAGAR
jgi:hypothetical protein